MDKSFMKQFILEQYTDLNTLESRKYEEDNDRTRNNYQRDYSRILYSSSFRRLQGKMQLLGIDSKKFYRNRLTHSLEVSQIARGIAEQLREMCGENIYQNDIYVIEACAIAHDIGNPPFGHHGERVLNELSKDVGGFEGNAQTFKILTTLEKKLPNHRGLNLTYRTQLGIIKYYNLYENGKNKKFIYDENYKEIKTVLEDKFPTIKIRTLDVQIIDLADEIAYAAHDLEDALSLKLFTIDEFIYEFNLYIQEQIKKLDNDLLSSKYDLAINTLKEIVDIAKKVADNAINYRSSEEYGYILRKEITSNLVNILIKDISPVKINEDFKNKTGTIQDYELGFNNLYCLSKGLKEYTFQCINRSNTVLLYEKKGEKIIRDLFELFTDESFNKNGLLLPAEYRPNAKDKSVLKRCVIDYLSGMMDTYAIETYENYFGQNSLDRIYK